MHRDATAGRALQPRWPMGRSLRMRNVFPHGLPVALLLTCALASPASAAAVILPDMAPIPQMEPAAPPAAVPETAPLPEEKPETANDENRGQEPQALPAEVPVPPAGPKMPDTTAAGERPQNDDAAAPPPEPATPRPPLDPRAAMRPEPSGIMPPDEVACRARLIDLGVAFTEHPAESNTVTGCAIPYPVVVTSLGKSIGLKPQAEMNCTMALAAATFMKDVVSPAAQSEYSVALASVAHASAYVCRPRHGTSKISEHAFGNALDIAAFTLAGGETVQVAADADEKGQRFLGAVRKAACGPFKTVLGPGSDADHALHFHFDLAPRRNGSTFCQ